MNILVTQFYKPENEDRFNELKYCLRRNLQNYEIDCVALLVHSSDVQYIKPHPKIKLFETDSRPTYKDHFEIGKSFITDGLIIITNSDIFITEWVIKLVSENLDESTVYALSRWDVKQDMTAVHYDTWDSQDTWIFKNTIKPGSYEIIVGIPGCDNRIAYELLDAGYNVENPSKSIQTYHYHISEYRSYKEIDRLEGEYHCITPTKL